jgi:hypothetical protein
MDIKTIRADIERLVAHKIDNGEPVAMAWLTQEILNDHADIAGSDVDFYVVCARYYVSDQVKRQIKKFEPSDTGQPDEQLVMEGFDHLQKAYPVERNAERVIMPITQMTIDELEERAAEYDVMAQGCIAHAEDIRRYIEQRQDESAAQ